METRPLGASDLRVSVVGLGCNNFGRRLDRDATRLVVEAALDAGVTFFDTADVYGQGESERRLGELLGPRRSDVVVATKFGNDMGGAAAAAGPGGSPAYVRAAVEASLRRLASDRIDLLYYHRPDGVTPLAQTLDAMVRLVDEGKVVAIACSNLTGQQLEEAVGHLEQTGGPPLAALQNEYSLLRRDAERDILPACERHRVGFVPYFPLASGLLTGKYRRGQPHPPGTRLRAGDERVNDDALSRVEKLEAFARERGHGLLELAIGALASRPAVASVIAGATSPDQLRANVAAAGWRLSAEELDALDPVPS